MKITIAITAFSASIFFCTYVNAQDFKSNNSNINEKQYRIKTSKGTRKYVKTDYSESSQPIQFPISNHQSSTLVRRGSRFNFNTLPPTGSGSTKMNKPLKSRGTRDPNC